MTVILVTGAAGFIGYHVSCALLAAGHEVVGIDNLNGYYDPQLKRARLGQLDGEGRFQFRLCDVSDRVAIAELFRSRRFDAVVHLAAQAGVRYSVENPQAYVDSNLVGFVNILEGCRHANTPHLVYASSSSVYGANRRLPFSERDNVDHPLSLYAATKKANELLAHSYSSLYGLPTTGLRFFTVYGPWGRPDMAIYRFTEAILNDRPIELYNSGRMQRDFTYVDDVAHVVADVALRPAHPDASWSAEHPSPHSSFAPYRVFNIGHHEPVEVLHVVELLEELLGKAARKLMLPMQPGDVPATFADIDLLHAECGFWPRTPIREGLGRFVEWYRDYHRNAITGLPAPRGRDDPTQRPC